MHRTPNRIALVVWLTVAGVAHAADHRDGSIAQDQPFDISDTYAFINPNDRSKLVVGITVNPYTVPGVPASFSTNALYQIKIDNDGDFVEDLVIQAVYDVLGARQQLKLLGPARPTQTGPINFLLRPSDTGRAMSGQHGSRRRVPVFEGPANGVVLEDPRRDLRVFAGRTDDPFFVDLIYLRSLLSVPGVPQLDELKRQRSLSGAPTPGVDLFTGLNVSTLMVELPFADISRDGKAINVWSTVSRRRVTVRSVRRGDRDAGDWIQIDRQGLPLINAALVPPELRDQYNRSSPEHDVRRFARAISRFLADKPNLLGNVYFELVSTTLLPDVLHVDAGSRRAGVADGDGPVPLDGRAPPDDVVDSLLAALTDGKLTSDDVDSNDCTPPGRDGICALDELENGFRVKFPFLGREHAPEEPIPARN